MDGSQVSVLEKGDEVSLSGLLESHDGRGLEAEIGLCGDNNDGGELQHSQLTTTVTTTYLEVLGDLTHETLEGQLADKQLSGLLVAPDFTEGDRSGPEAMRLLDTAGRSLRKQTGANKR